MLGSKWTHVDTFTLSNNKHVVNGITFNLLNKMTEIGLIFTISNDATWWGNLIVCFNDDRSSVFLGRIDPSTPASKFALKFSVIYRDNIGKDTVYLTICQPNNDSTSSIFNFSTTVQVYLPDFITGVTGTLSIYCR